MGLSVEYEPSSDPILHPGKTARLVCSGKVVGVIGEVLPRVLERFDMEGSPVALFEVDLISLIQAVPQDERRYQSTSRFPESYRDFALTVDFHVLSAKVQAIIERHKLVVRASPFDVYSGEEIPVSKKSLAYTVTFPVDLGHSDGRTGKQGTTGHPPTTPERGGRRAAAVAPKAEREGQLGRSSLDINIANLGKGVGGRLKVAILVLTLLLILGAVACGGNGAATPTPGPKLPTAQELKQAAEDLFTAVSAAAAAQDAAAFLELMPASVRELCTAEQLQEPFASDDATFPEVEVTSVLVDLEDPDQALVRVKLRIDPQERSLEGLATAFITAFPFPMVREEGQ